MSVLDWLNAWVENCVVSERPANRSGSSMCVACPLAVGFFKLPDPSPAEVNKLSTDLKFIWGLKVEDL